MLKYVKMDVRDGHTICGIDFGRHKNHIVGCQIIVDSTHIDGYRILNWEAIDLGDGKIEDVVAKLTTQQSPLFESDWFILEQQVPRTGRFAMNIFCYVLSHVLQYKLLTKDVGRVLFARATAKFKQLDPKRVHCPGLPDRKLTYTKRKQWATNLCRFHTQHQDRTSCVLFETWRKKDDLADAFLYAYAFFIKHVNCTFILDSHK